MKTPRLHWIVSDGERLAEPFLDLSAEVSTGFERGLLGLAFHPEYAENGRFFVNYTDSAGDTVVAEYGVSGDPDVADPASGDPILGLDQPAANHNGGMIEFGPDGYLYVGTGDGGGAGDEFDNAQDLGTLHGALLRLDVDAEGESYAIPADNPFVDDGDARDEIWAYGLRNAWRFSFDREAGTLFIGDVGQSAWEEIDAEPASAAGLNYGWPCFEGTDEYEPSRCDGLSELDLTDPVYEYENAGATCSVTGGYVYRGECVGALEGRYVFGDFCSAQIWSFSLEGGEATDVRELTEDLDPDGVLEDLASFGRDAYGELYVTSLGTGEVYRLVAAGAE